MRLLELIGSFVITIIITVIFMYVVLGIYVLVR